MRCWRASCSTSRAGTRRPRRRRRRWPVPPAEQASSTIERMLAIKAMPLFVDVHPDELAVIAEHASLRTFSRGETLYAGAQAPVSTIHLVLDGAVTEYRRGRPFVTHRAQHVLG